MRTYAALLRGINVGRAKQIDMAGLRSALAGLGYGDVRTYLRSGNVLFRSSGADPAQLSSAISDRIAAEYGTAVSVLIRTADELADVVARSPLPAGPENPSRFFVAFLSGVPDPAAARDLAGQRLGEDRAWVSGSEAYLWCPGGAADTRLTHAFVEKALGVTATSRNWNTVGRLVSMSRD